MSASNASGTGPKSGEGYTAVQQQDFTDAVAAPHKKTGAEIEKDLINSGKMPGLKHAGPEHREPGEDDEAGNKVHHRTALGRLLHGEHNAMNEEH
ncbi:hypothetical protein B0A49_04366 [Cryomyces minteri]|uniref:Uncharacterized protein n=1 Tax=Cryomyces minteri TaxID=331657 RepID=A0A4U0X319_9PEZI|nr:hypothetical protein B0A49_04366 [Cryomyces minteri]